MICKPSLSFDADGTPRITLTNEAGAEISARVDAEGLAEFLGQVKTYVMRKGGDPDVQRKLGKSLIDVLSKWVQS